MITNLTIVYTDLNGEKHYFYSFNDFYQYLEFTTQFPGLFNYEFTPNLSWYRWVVQYNIKWNEYTYVELIDFNTGQTFKIDLVKKVIISPGPGWWLTNPETYEQIIGLYMKEFVRIYKTNYVQFDCATGNWYGIDVVNNKIYLSKNPKDAMRAVIIFWKDSDWQRLTITY